MDREDRLEKEMATHSSMLAWGNPMDRGAWQAAVDGGHQRVKRNLSRPNNSTRSDRAM